MKTLPILFSTDMVQSTLARIKKKTRRTNGLELLNERPDDFTWHGKVDEWFTFHDCTSVNTDNKIFQKIKCPYGQSGDLLWVRETWAPALSDYAYKADYSNDTLNEPRNKGLWKASIHMPKAACRIWLKVANVRVERLRDITSEDSIAEGVEQITVWDADHHKHDIRYRDYKFHDKHHPKARYFFNPVQSFMTLWKSLNGEQSWHANPWVWVIEFELVSTTGVNGLPQEIRKELAV